MHLFTTDKRGSMILPSFPVLLFMSLACIRSSSGAETRVEPKGNITSTTYGKQLTAISSSGANVTCFKASLASVAKERIGEALRFGHLVEITNSLSVWIDRTRTLKISVETTSDDDVVRLLTDNYNFAFDEIETACGKELPLSGKKSHELTLGAWNVWNGTLHDVNVKIFLDGIKV